jgi:hypothetical protein
MGDFSVTHWLIVVAIILIVGSGGRGLFDGGSSGEPPHPLPVTKRLDRSEPEEKPSKP